MSKADALADLMRNSENSFYLLRSSGNLGVKNSEEYFQEQLRRLGLDQNNAAGIWQQVLLFRRLFHDVGGSVFIDPLTFEKYNAYASASLEGQLYQLPNPLRLNSFKELQKFETYLDAAGKLSADQKAKLFLPETFYSVQELIKENPELVQKRYYLEIASVNKKDLESGVGLRQSWEWESSEEKWGL